MTRGMTRLFHTNFTRVVRNLNIFEYCERWPTARLDLRIEFYIPAI